MHESALDIIRRPLVIEHHIHGVSSKHSIFRTPWLWGIPQDEIFERLGTEAIETGVYAGDIRIHDFSLVGRHLRDDPAGTAAKAVKPVSFVRLKHRRPDYFSKFAGCLPATEIHLEKTILSVYEARTERKIRPVFRSHRRNANRIAFDRYPG